MKTYASLLSEYNSAKKIADEKLYDLRSFDTGYLWLVNICAYGSSHWESFSNIHGVQELCDEYRDGYDGMLHIFTNDPDTEQPEDYGCVSEFKRMSSEELHNMEQPYKSRTAGLLSFILPRY